MGKSTIFLLICGLCPILAVAEIFKYTDESGKTHFVSEQAQIPEQYRDNAIDSSSMRAISKAPKAQSQSANINKSQAAPGAKTQTAGQMRKVEIYVTSWCPYCRNLEKFLRERKIPYSRYDVEREAYGKKFYASVGRGAVPIIKVGKTTIRGFKPQEVLNAARIQ